jgi:hypothetical protein
MLKLLFADLRAVTARSKRVSEANGRPEFAPVWRRTDDFRSTPDCFAKVPKRCVNNFRKKGEPSDNRPSMYPLARQRSC